jgi:hypothetical protein
LLLPRVHAPPSLYYARRRPDEDMLYKTNVLVLDGVFTEQSGGSLAFNPAPPPTTQEVNELLATARKRILRHLGKHGLLDDDHSDDDLLSEQPSLLASCYATSIARRQTLGAMVNDDVLVRVLSAHARLRQRVIAYGREPLAAEPVDGATAAPKHKRRQWCELMRRAFGYDLLDCSQQWSAIGRDAHDQHFVFLHADPIALLQGYALGNTSCCPERSIYWWLIERGINACDRARSEFIVVWVEVAS